MLSAQAGETRTPAYLALNPRGHVPTLVEGDVVLYESIAILAYLEARWPSPPLFGTAPRETGEIWRVIAECTCYLQAAAEAFILPLYFGDAEGRAAELEQAARTIHAELARITASLAHSPYLVGDALSAADLVMLPAVQSLLRAAGKPAAAALAIPFLPLAPELDAWRARLEALPYYARTYPPHWR